MTMSKQATDLRGSAKKVLTTKRRQAGTSLVEILVVIVIFLIGILAVVQVFPRGFRLLLTTRNNSMATALGRDEMERLKARPDLLPDEILAVRYVNGFPEFDPALDPLSLGPDPQADSIRATDGHVITAGSDGGNWMLASGPNRARRIIGEGQRVPAARMVGSDFGGLMVLDHGPIDKVKPIVAYANELSKTVGAPLDAADKGVFQVGAYSADGQTPIQSFDGHLIYTPVSTAPYEFFVVNPATPEALILFPTARFDRFYRVRVSGLVGTPAGYRRVDFVSLTVKIPAYMATDATLVQVSINDLLVASGAITGESLGSAEVDTIRVAPQYARVSSFTGGNPFEFMILDPNVGTLLFNPAGRDGAVSRPGGVSEPLMAKVDYDVLDWRIIHEEFRALGTGQGSNQTFSFPLSLQSIKVGSQNGPDGRPNGPITQLEGVTNSPTDNVVIIDLTTGFQVDKSSGYVTVDKSRGVVTLHDADNQSGLTVRLINPNGSAILAPAENRTFRVLYRARNEWAVQLLKGDSQYSVLQNSLPGQGQAVIGGPVVGGNKWMLYFQAGEAGRKVTIDRIVYNVGGEVHTLEGQDFIIRPAGPLGGSLSLPFVNLAELVNGAQFDTSGALGEPVSGVKGASVSVRVLWNPDAFSLATDASQNITKAGVWGRGWRKSTTDTYLRAEETR